MDAELNGTEAELQAEEAALQSELSQLATVSRELADRMIALRVSASRTGAQAIAQRAQVVPPVIDAEGGFRKARVAREAAVKARREANTTVRTLANAAKAQLQKLAAQVIADEKALTEAEEAASAATQIQPAVVAPAPSAAARATPKAEVPQNLEKKQHRTTNRVKMQAAVDFSSDDNFFNGFSANISDGGLFVATVNVLPLGTEVDLSFSLPSGQRVEARGVVRWVREVNDKLPEAFPGMGVQFAALSNSAQTAIDQFLAQRDPMFFAEAE